MGMIQTRSELDSHIAAGCAFNSVHNLMSVMLPKTLEVVSLMGSILDEANEQYRLAVKANDRLQSEAKKAEDPLIIRDM